MSKARIVISGVGTLYSDAQSNYIEESQLYTKTRSPRIGRINRLGRIILAAACKAFANSGLEIRGSERRNDVGVTLGTWYGSQAVNEEYLSTVANKGFGEIIPSSFVLGTANAVSGMVAVEFSLGGPNMTLMGLSSGIQAIAAAADHIVNNRASLMLAGGVDSLTNFLLETIENYKEKNDRIVSSICEGASVLCLETEESCFRRGARPLAIIDGWHMCNPRSFIPQKGEIDAVIDKSIQKAGVRTPFYTISVSPYIKEGPYALAAAAPIALAKEISESGKHKEIAIVSYGWGSPVTSLVVRKCD